MIPTVAPLQGSSPFLTEQHANFYSTPSVQPATLQLVSDAHIVWRKQYIFESKAREVNLALLLAEFLLYH